jgi:hypothetical protein
VRSNIHEALLSALAAILRPTVKLLLHSGISFDEFTNVAKAVFVHVATEEYKRRGRPANFSQVSAMTGISRKDVSKIRDPKLAERWTPDMEISPVNTILQHWHFDSDFSDGAGKARALPFEGAQSFSTLVARHAGDIPAGAMKSTLQKAGVIQQDANGLLVVSKPYYYARQYDADFIRVLAFSASNHGLTLTHNSVVHQRGDLSNEAKRQIGRLERTVWSEHLSPEGIAKFKQWVDDSAPRFLEKCNRTLARHELPRNAWDSNRPRVTGVGVYYFEED